MSVIDMKVPVIGESISEVTIAVFLKQDGDIVKNSIQKQGEGYYELGFDLATKRKFGNRKRPDLKKGLFLIVLLAIVIFLWFNAEKFIDKIL